VKAAGRGGVFHRRLAHKYPTIDHGEGVYLYDTAGRRYIDAAGGALVVNIGHGVRDVVEAMQTQAAAVAFVHGTQFTSASLEHYAEALGQVAPLGDARAYLVSGGSEAVETALKLARQVCISRGDVGRYKVISRWGAYHGATLGALSASGRPPLRKPYAPMLLDMPHIPPPYCYRCPFGQEYPACGTVCADALETEILRQGPETVAAFVAEPVIGATLAAVVPPPEYWPRISEICHRHNVLLIADEVMTGFGRTGRWFAVDHWKVVPDILVSAKGASGGYWPLGVVMVSSDIVEAIRAESGQFVHGFTYANNVMGAAVGAAVLEYLRVHDLVRASERLGRYLLSALEQLCELDHVGDVRGLGLMVGLEMVADGDSRRPFPRAAQVAEKVQAAALERGVNVYCGTGMADGVDGDALLLGPPFVVTEPQIDEVVRVLSASIRAVLAEIPR
jgi:adenosylmethionine-8-amino-7-oxononanoate aminotransferase